MSFSEELIQQVWEKGRVISGQDHITWRKDECGAWMKRDHYEYHNSQFGWKIENVSPGGADEIANLRPFHRANSINRASGKLHCQATAEPEGIANK